MKKKLFVAAGFLAAFAVWTGLLCVIDAQPIGPLGSSVGFATINAWVRDLIGVHMWLYTVTDWLGLVPVAAGLGFATLGLVQWLRRKKLLKVDYSILVLGGFYLVVLAVYLLFEYVVVNRRPVLIDGFLEASYPSSTTMLVMCVMPTAQMQLSSRIKGKVLRKWICCTITVFIVFMVIGRVVSGVHWLSDIIGGALISTGLVKLYCAVAHMK